MEKKPRLVDHLKYHRDLILASRANIAGIFSLAVVVSGVINERLDIAGLGAALMVASGAIMWQSVRRS